MAQTPIKFNWDCRKCLVNTMHTIEEDSTEDPSILHINCDACGNDARVSKKDLPRELKVLLGGHKDDQDKPLIHLMPVEVLFALAKLFTIGAQKYRADNWKKGTEFSRWYNAMQRHAMAWWLREELDPDNGQHHLDSVIWNAMALRYYMEYYEHYKVFDDRPELPSNLYVGAISIQYDQKRKDDVKMRIPYADAGKQPTKYLTPEELKEIESENRQRHESSKKIDE